MKYRSKENWKTDLNYELLLSKDVVPRERKKQFVEFKKEFHHPAELIFLLPQHLVDRVFQLHKNFEGRMTRLSASSLQYYVLPQADFIQALEKIAPKYIAEFGLQENAQLVILLALPPLREFSATNFLPMVFCYWGILFQALIYKKAKQTLQEGKIIRSQIHEFFEWCGSEFYEEIQRIVKSDRRVSGQNNEAELLLEFSSYYFHAYYFSPSFLKTFFPSLTQFSSIAKRLQSFSFNPIELLEHSRPKSWGPQIQELLAQQEAKVKELEGTEENIVSKHYIANFLKHPWILQRFSEDSPSYSGVLIPFATEVIQKFFYQNQPINKFSFLNLVNNAVCFPKTIDGPTLLLFNRVLNVLFPRLYHPASLNQRLQIYLLGPLCIEKLKQQKKRFASTKDSLEKLQKVKEKPSATVFEKLRHFLFLCTGLPLFYLLLSFLLRRFELIGSVVLPFMTPLFQRISDAYRIKRFEKQYGLFQQTKTQERFVTALLALNEAILFFEEIGGRYLLEDAQKLRDDLENEFFSQVDWVVAKIFIDLKLVGTDQSHLAEFLRHLVYASRNKQEPIAKFLLIDLEFSYMEGRRKLFWLDFKGWLFSFGKKTIRHPLRFYPNLRRLKKLKLALTKIARLPLSHQDYLRYYQVLENAMSRFERELQEDLKVALNPVFEEIQFSPKSYQEKIAIVHLQEEITRTIVENQYLNCTQLRDILSRNELKLKDLKLDRLAGSDIFSKLDRKLGRRFKGVYYSGEIYLKVLYAISGLFFGTVLGRFFSKHLIFPFGLSCAILAAFQLFLFSTVEKLQFFSVLSSYFIVSLAVLIELMVYTKPGKWFSHLLFFILKGLFLGAIHLIKFCCYILPYTLIRLIDKIIPYSIRTNILAPILSALGLCILFYQYFVPHHVRSTIWDPVIFFAALSILFYLLNPLWLEFTRKLRVLTFDLGWIWLRNTIIACFKFFLRFCQGIFIVLEKIIYGIEQHLRLKQGEWLPITLLKSFLTFLCFWPIYLARIYVRVFLEPQVNPLKFPVVSLTYKVWFPIAITFINQHEKMLDGFFWPTVQILNHGIAYWVVQFHAFIFTGFFGFLVWELKQNWGLYNANRSRTVGKAGVLDYGETLSQILYTGPHPGVVPILYQKLRTTIKEGAIDADVIRVRRIEMKLQDIKRKIYHFTYKHLIYGLELHPIFATKTSFKVQNIRLLVGGLYLSLKVGEKPDSHLVIKFEMKGEKLLVSSSLTPEASNELTLDQKGCLDLALLVFYKKSGVALIEEQIVHYLEARYAKKLAEAKKAQTIKYSLQKNRLMLHLPIEGYHGWKEVYYKISPRSFRAKTEDLVSAAIDLQLITFWAQSIFWKDYNGLMDAENFEYQAFEEKYSPLLSKIPTGFVQSTMTF